MKKDYKDSINLPKTAFPMKANLPEREPEILKRWQELNIYKRTREARRDCPRFILHDGPPYANGHIHIGHAVNKTLKDIVIKSKILSGYDAPYIPGWDCHGLPIEINVEKVHGKPSEKISAERFRKACREYALEQIDIQREEFIRLGGLGDWYNPYITMAPTYEADIIRSLAKIIANGHLFRGYKPVHWCVDCCSALAEAEVEYRDKSSPAIDVKFTVLDDAALMVRCQVTETIKGGGPISIVIWTTTPWTLPANYAVAVSPKLEYVLVECEGQYGKERFILAEALVEDTLSRYGIEHYRIIGSCLGAALEGLKLQHPFYDRVVPIVLGDHVTLDTGTGAVHTAPGHGPEDYLIALKYNLPIESTVDVDGKFLLKTPLFAGEHINKANEHIIEILQAKGHLLHIEKIQHSYPHCWRHKTSLIFRATPQWFISMDQNGLRRQVIDEIFKVEWLPDWGQARLAGMIENRPDWCISRQRTWGVPLPLFTHKETGELHPDMINIMESVAQLMDEKGIEAWHQLEPETLLGPEAQYYEKCSDVLDVWFDSGVSHAAVLEKNPSLHQPADMYLEGSDQHRGWFQSSLLTAVAMRGQAPYKTVLTHGFAVDAHGRKMSKSLGNVIAPEKVISSLGADILRLWIAATDYRAEMSVSDEILKRMADTYRRIRNTARYLLANLYDFDPEQHLIPKEAMLSLDRWAVDRARILQGQIINAYDEYQFHLIYQKIHNFCTVDLGSFYLDIIKDRQYTTPKESLTRRSAQTAMYHIAEALTRWLAPILSFTAEEIWQYLPGKRPKSVFLTTWYEDFVTVGEDETMGQLFWEQILIIRDSVNKALEIARNEGKIGSPLDAELDLYCSSELYKKLALLDNELRFVFIVSEARVHPEKEKPAELEFSEMPGLAIKISASSYQKCARCWHHRPDIGRDKQHPDLCGRCVTNITTEGEVRYFV